MRKNSPIKALGMASSETMLVEPDSLDEQSEARPKLRQNIRLTKDADLQPIPLILKLQYPLKTLTLGLGLRTVWTQARSQTL